MGTGQIFRVSNADATKFAPVGLILSNSYHIQENEKSGFYAVVTDKPATYFTGEVAKPQPVEPPTAAAPAALAPGAAPATFTGKASWGDDGHTPVVQSQNDSKFNNDVVAWRKGHIEIERNGAKFADLGYTGGGYGEGAAKRGLKTSLNEINAAVSNGRHADVLSNGWEIITIKGGRNTAVVTAASANGIYQQNPYGLEGEAVAATELFRGQLDPTFTYPGYDKLRQAAGLPPLPTSPASRQQPSTKSATTTQ